MQARIFSTKYNKQYCITFDINHENGLFVNITNHQNEMVRNYSQFAPNHFKFSLSSLKRYVTEPTLKELMKHPIPETFIYFDKLPIMYGVHCTTLGQYIKAFEGRKFKKVRIYCGTEVFIWVKNVNVGVHA